MRLRLIALILFSPIIMALSAAPALADQSVQQAINNGLSCGSNLELPPNTNSCNDSTKGASTSITKFAQHVVAVLSWIVGLVAVVMIIFGGFRYVTSGGNDSSVTSAKNTILYAIIGLVIVALSQIIVHFTIRNISG